MVHSLSCAKVRNRPLYIPRLLPVSEPKIDVPLFRTNFSIVILDHPATQTEHNSWQTERMYLGSHNITQNVFDRGEVPLIVDSFRAHTLGTFRFLTDSGFLVQDFPPGFADRVASVCCRHLAGKKPLWKPRRPLCERRRADDLLGSLHSANAWTDRNALSRLLRPRFSGSLPRLARNRNGSGRRREPSCDIHGAPDGGHERIGYLFPAFSGNHDQ